MSDDQLKPSERGPTNDEIIAEAKRISDLEWEGNEEHADFFGPLLFRLQADTSWFKPVPEVDPLVAQLVEIFRALPLYGDAGCDKLTDAEWRFVASAACEALAKRPRGWLGRPATCDEVDMSMTPLVETVARAISWKIDAHGDTERIEQQRVSLEWPRYREHAQAAIAAVFDALETPSESVLRNGAAKERDFMSYLGVYPRTHAVWKAMLAKAREEILG